ATDGAVVVSRAGNAASVAKAIGAGPCVGNRSTAVGIPATRNGASVAKAIGAGPCVGDRSTGIRIPAARNGALVTKVIRAGPCLGNRTTGKPLSRSGSGTREDHRQSGGKNCKDFHDWTPFRMSPLPIEGGYLTISHSPLVRCDRHHSSRVYS